MEVYVPAVDPELRHSLQAAERDSAWHFRIKHASASAMVVKSAKWSTIKKLRAPLRHSTTEKLVLD